MKVLLVGNGGREHALAWRLGNSPSVGAIICPGGNPGIASVADTPAVKLNSVEDWAEFGAREKVDLVVIGPEVPLEQGLADECLKRGLAVFGPPRAGARIESSKAFAKEIMQAAGIPTAKAESFTDPDQAKAFARSLGLPVVIKADGLAAGKGVTVAQTQAEVDQAIDENLVQGRFGASSASVLVEEFMEGEEASVFGLCDGTRVFPLVAAQDHKRAFENDEGPNTGGMGAYAPTPFVDDAISEAIHRDVLVPALNELRRRGIDYRGVLYAGLMLTKEGPKVVEFNCRFGDPETQVVLPLLEGDFGELLLACAQGRLTQAPTTRNAHAITVVLASGGYPGDYTTGYEIDGLSRWNGAEDAVVFHAGTIDGGNGRVLTNGGRVLSCTAWDSSLARAKDRVYEICDSIGFQGKHRRRDIAARILQPRG